MNIDIKNMNTSEKRNTLYTTEWRTIYEVIEPDKTRFFNESDIFQMILQKNARIMQMNILIYQLR